MIALFTIWLSSLALQLPVYQPQPQNTAAEAGGHIEEVNSTKPTRHLFVSRAEVQTFHADLLESVKINGKEIFTLPAGRFVSIVTLVRELA